MNALGIIPARYASTRFPGKPLAEIDGRSMIRRVYEQCLQCPDLSRVIVATDHPEILSHVLEFGGEAKMTSDRHRSGTERCAEVVEILRREGTMVPREAVINIQGDEPFIDPGQISEVAAAFGDPSTLIATLAGKITDPADITDPNVVKVVFTAEGRALYFSRSPVPFMRNVPAEEWIERGTFYRHVGIYGYLPEVLDRLVTLPASPLETAESLEQLRWLEAGFPVTVRETGFESIAVDTPSDLLKITNRNPRNRG